MMVIGAIAAMAVTYITSIKAVFGPHLLVGLGMTAMIAVSASLSPLCKRGQLGTLHPIVLNSAL